MRKFTTDWLNAHQARIGKRDESVISDDAAEEESKLQADIIDYCTRKDWMVFYGSMAHRTKRPPGEPDFWIVTDSKIVMVEAKSKTGDRSPAQRKVAAHAKRLGHTVHLVRSMSEFEAVIKANQKFQPI